MPDKFEKETDNIAHEIFALVLRLNNIKDLLIGEPDTGADLQYAVHCLELAVRQINQAQIDRRMR